MGASEQGNVKDHTVVCDYCGDCFPQRRRRLKYSIVDFVMMAHNTRPVQLRMKCVLGLYEAELNMSSYAIKELSLR